MLFILFAACVGHIGAMEPDKKAGPKPQGMQQGTNVPTLTQLAAIAKVKDLIQKIHSAKSPQQAIDAYRTVKTSDFFTLPTDLQQPLLAEIGRQYYILYGEELDTGVPWGVSIQDYLTSPALQNKMPLVRTVRENKELNLADMKINNLQGLENITNIGIVQRLILKNNQLTTIQPDTFAVLPNLQTLRLENNQLTTIKLDTFAGLPKLRWLDLRKNQLKDIQPKAFADLTNLDRLVISNNQLTTIQSDTFAGLTKLGWLYLNSNQLKDIQPKAFADLTNLHRLFLGNNQLKDIQPNAFAGIPNLGILELSGNQLDEKTKDAIKKALPGVKIDF